MLIRSAFWIGHPSPGEEDRFRAILTDEVAPAVRCCPGVAAVRLLWPDERDDDAPAIFCQFLVEFPDAAAKAAMIASPERQAFAPLVQSAKELFDGSLTHINFTAA